MRVCYPRPPEGGRARLEALLDPAVRLADRDYEILVEGTPERDQMRAGLRAVLVPYAGVPERTRELLREFPGVALHNLHHNAAPTAELALALLLAAAKRIVPIDRALREGDWRPRYADERPLLLAGRTALVLGLGAIGRRVADGCRALGMEVVATRRSEPRPLDDLLPRAHALVVCLPLTPETEGLLDAGRLAALPNGAVLVNVGRGRIVGEAALFAELQSGRIAAGLDVWYRYPDSEAARARTPPADHPFGALDNVVLSPHRGGLADGTEELRCRALAAALNAAARGEPIPHRVDLEAGY